MNVDINTILENQLSHPLEGTHLPSLGKKYEGKVRDCYTTADQRRIIVVSDRLSAFDVVLGTIPFKGQVLNQMAQYWFEQSREIASNHMLDVPDPNVMVARECVPLQAEFVMRSYLTGVTSTSIWRSYEAGDREFCGHSLPEGMVKNQKLPASILTPSTKAEKGHHDISVSREELLSMGHVEEGLFNQAAALAHTLFAFGQEKAATRGLILVDTKYEMGVSPEGELMLIDEIHTPDSSRYWFAEDYEERMAKGEEPRSLDKEYVRRWMSDTHGYHGEGPPPSLDNDIRVEAAKRYIEIYELITGLDFVPEPSLNPQERIALSLGVSL